MKDDPYDYSGAWLATVGKADNEADALLRQLTDAENAIKEWLDKNFVLDRGVVCRAILRYHNRWLLCSDGRKGRPNGKAYYDNMRAHLYDTVLYHVMDEYKPTLYTMFPSWYETPRSRTEWAIKNKVIEVIDKLMRKNSKAWCPVIYTQRVMASDLMHYIVLDIKRRVYYSEPTHPDWLADKDGQIAMLLMIGKSIDCVPDVGSATFTKVRTTMVLE